MTSKLEGLEECPLHTRTPFGIRNVTQTQFSIARYYGGCKFDGDHFVYFPDTDELVRDDVLHWKNKVQKKKKAPTKAKKRKPSANQPTPE